MPSTSARFLFSSNSNPGYSGFALWRDTALHSPEIAVAHLSQGLRSSYHRGGGAGGSFGFFGLANMFRKNNEEACCPGWCGWVENFALTTSPSVWGVCLGLELPALLVRSSSWLAVAGEALLLLTGTQPFTFHHQEVALLLVASCCCYPASCDQRISIMSKTMSCDWSSQRVARSTSAHLHTHGETLSFWERERTHRK